MSTYLFVELTDQNEGTEAPVDWGSNPQKEKLFTRKGILFKIVQPHSFRQAIYFAPKIDLPPQGLDWGFMTVEQPVVRGEERSRTRSDLFSSVVPHG